MEQFSDEDLIYIWDYLSSIYDENKTSEILAQLKQDNLIPILIVKTHDWRRILQRAATRSIPWKTI